MFAEETLGHEVEGFFCWQLVHIEVVHSLKAINWEEIK